MKVFSNYPELYKPARNKSIYFPYSLGADYILEEQLGPETVCPFEEKTGVIDYAVFDPDTSVVTIEAEPDNPVDPFALKVLIDNIWVGYFYRRSGVRTKILEAMNSSRKAFLLGRIASMDDYTGKLEICIGIYRKVKMKRFRSIGKCILKGKHVSSMKEVAVDTGCFVRAEKEYNGKKTVISLFDNYGRYLGRIPYKTALFWDRKYTISDMRFRIIDAERREDGSIRYEAEAFAKKKESPALMEI